MSSTQHVPCLADEVFQPRCTKRAPRRALRRRQQLRSALRRRWRMSARSLTSRRAASPANRQSAADSSTIYAQQCG
jgi:hypothetical protein